MLPSQRALFDVPRDVCFLNAASWSPLPLASMEAGRAGVARKGRPWTISAEFAAQQYDRARSAAARLINAEPSDVALISSVGYGVATAAKILPIAAGSRILTLKDDHTSPALPWMSRAEKEPFTVEAVNRRQNESWTEALLSAIERPGAAPLALASFSSVHWSDAGMVDLSRVAAALRNQNAALLVDATQSAGVLAMDVRTLDPDFVVFPTYKWLIGPYGRAFLYIAKRNQNGIPLEQTSYGRRAVRAEQHDYFADTRYVDSAQRFDMGERDHFISLEMASVGMEMMAQWGSKAVSQRLADLTERLAAVAQGIQLAVACPHARAPHILSLEFAGGVPSGLVEALAAEKVHVAPRLGRLRISPHVYNDEADVEAFAAAMKRVLPRFRN
jgi:selenocysteine lyase/cysteine desulfurase